MSRVTNLRRALWIIVLGWGGTSGCIHNHYYGTAMPGCPPVGTPVTTQVGSICDVPSSNVVISGASSSAVSSNVTTRPSSASTMNGPSRVVISQPAYGPPSIGQGSGWMKWRKPDPDSPPTMKAEGGVDDTTIR